jgi:hypothetical protein
MIIVNSWIAQARINLAVVLLAAGEPALPVEHSTRLPGFYRFAMFDGYIWKEINTHPYK